MKKKSSILHNYQIKIITRQEEFEELEAAWNLLLKQLGNSNFFLSFEWMLTWWKCLGFEKELLIFVIKNGDETVGIAPLMKEKRSISRVSFYEICFISTIEVAYSPGAFSGTLDILINPEHESAREVFFRYLLTEIKGWNRIRLHPLPEDSQTLRILHKIGQDLNIKIDKKKVFDNAYLQIKESWETYFAGRPKKFRKNLVRAKKKLSENRKIAFVEYRNPEDINEALKNLKLVESRAWKVETGIHLDDEENHHFYFELAKVISEKRWLRVWVLKIDDIPIAYDYHIDYFGNIKTLKGSYDKTFAAFSPGSLLSWKAHQLFFQEGAEGVDLLWGNLDYKQKWTNCLLPHYEISIYQSNSYSRFIKFMNTSSLVKHISIRFRKFEGKIIKIFKHW
ncbi:MAG: GNAT family N-acetyltransferase [Ignavibacteria bacterium]|nr:GNAT family N-acetyltransferase [Ignavibacteria bacterium]